jgi:dUTPase
MNVGFHSKKDAEPEIEDNIFTFSCAKPIIIQPSEIKKVQTDITLEIDPGFILNIISAPNIYNQAAEVFPGPYVIDQKTPKSILEIPIRNHGRDPLHLMEGSVIARGYLTQVAEIHIKKIEPVTKTRNPVKRGQPSRKGRAVKFEVK